MQEIKPRLSNLPKTKILILSDFHLAANSDFRVLGNLEHGVDYDICFTLGDIDQGDLRDIKKMLRNVHGVAGNHDAKGLLEAVGIDNLDKRAIKYNGIRIVGVSGGFKYKNNDSLSMLTQSESSYIASNLPAADILISHDSGYCQITDEYAHQGLVGISEYIERYNPVIHLYGHHHINRFDLIGETNSFCVYKCSILDTETMEMRNLF